jgi:hypothetical protein
MSETLSQIEWAKNVSGHCKQTERHADIANFHRQRLRSQQRMKRLGTRGTDMAVCTSSLIRTMTVGSGIAPDLLTPRSFARALAGSWTALAAPHTAGGELHPALKTY